MADMPDTAVARRNQTDLGMSRLRSQLTPSHSPRPISAVQMPTMMSKAQWSIVLAGGRSSGGTESSPVTFVSVLQPTRNESKPGMPMPPLTPSEVQRPKMYSVTCVEVFCTHSIAANLTGWSSAIERAAVSPTANWIGVSDAGDGEGDQQPEAVMAVPPPPEHPDRVHRRHEEAGDEVGGEDHVRNLVAGRAVEERVDRVHVRHAAVGGDLEAVRLVHPGVDRDHGEGTADPGDRHRDAGPEVRPAGEALPAVDVDRDEDRLGEEEDALDRERRFRTPRRTCR